MSGKFGVKRPDVALRNSSEENRLKVAKALLGKKLVDIVPHLSTFE